MNNRSILLVIFGLIIGLITGFGATYMLLSSSNLATSTQSHNQREILYWVAPMDATFRRDKPGKSPMGMDLVPVYADNNQEEENNIIKLNAEVTNNIAVKLGAVEQKKLTPIVRTTGYVAPNENNIEHLHVYAEGWIRQLFVKTTNEEVKKGQPLLTLYSPTVTSAQEELLLAVKSNSNALIDAGKKKLATLGMRHQDIEHLLSSREVTQAITVYAPATGVISKLNVREGQYIKPDTDLMTIENYTSIWIIADVFERQAKWVKKGQAALARVPYLQEKQWHGVIDYVYPSLDNKTHTLPVRMIFPNPDLNLKPNMFVDVELVTQATNATLVVPEESVIRLGSEARVMQSLGEGRFKSVAVKLGAQAQGYYEIKEGLILGDKVVISGQFLLDSESSKRAEMMRIEAVDDKPSAKSAPQQGEMTTGASEIISMGKVLAVDADSHAVTIKHEEIKSINMPAMQMTIAVMPQVDLSDLQPGDHIHFVMHQHDDHLMITMIHIMEERP